MSQKEKQLFARLLASELYVCFTKQMIVNVKALGKEKSEYTSETSKNSFDMSVVAAVLDLLHALQALQHIHMTSRPVKPDQRHFTVAWHIYNTS